MKTGSQACHVRRCGAMRRLQSSRRLPNASRAPPNWKHLAIIFCIVGIVVATITFSFIARFLSGATLANTLKCGTICAIGEKREERMLIAPIPMQTITRLFTLSNHNHPQLVRCFGDCCILISNSKTSHVNWSHACVQSVLPYKRRVNWRSGSCVWFESDRLMNLGTGSGSTPPAPETVRCPVCGGLPKSC